MSTNGPDEVVEVPTSLVTAAQVATYLGVTTQRVYDLCRLDMLPHVRVGRSLRFCPARTMDWVASGGRALPGGWRKEAV